MGYSGSVFRGQCWKDWEQRLRVEYKGMGLRVMGVTVGDKGLRV